MNENQILQAIKELSQQMVAMEKRLSAQMVAMDGRLSTEIQDLRNQNAKEHAQNAREHEQMIEENKAVREILMRHEIDIIKIKNSL